MKKGFRRFLFLNETAFGLQFPGGKYILIKWKINFSDKEVFWGGILLVSCIEKEVFQKTESLDCLEPGASNWMFF